MAITGIIEDGVRDKLLATAGVTALTSTRIWTVRAPEAATRSATGAQLVYAVIARDGGAEDKVMHTGGATTLAVASLMIGVFGATFAAARVAANTIRDSINGTRGAFGDESVSYCLVRDLQQAEAPPSRDDEIGVPGYALTVEIAYRTT